MAKKKPATSRKTTTKKKTATTSRTASASTKKTTPAKKAAPKAKAKTKTARGPKVRDVMSTTISVCHPHSSLAEAAQIMWQRDCGFVPVVGMATGTIAGVITDRDIAMSAAIHGHSLHEVQVHAAMSPTVHAVEADDTVASVHTLMREQQIHRAPVVDADGMVVGVVSLNDLARDAVAGDASGPRREIALTLGAISQPHPSKAKAAARKRTKAAPKASAGTQGQLI